MALKKTVRELLTGIPGPMSPAELLYWRAYDRIDPFGADRMDLGFGTVAATVANCHRSKDVAPYSAGDFMWEYKPREECGVQTPEQVVATIDAYFGVMAAKNRAALPPAPAEPYPLKDEPTQSPAEVSI